LIGAEINEHALISHALNIADVRGGGATQAALT